MIQIEFPKLELNPFMLKPIKNDQGNLFSGRERELATISTYIKFRSSRFAVVHGPKGIGKTSFLNVVSNASSMPVLIDSIQIDSPYNSLIEGVYSAMIGYDIPSNWRQIESDLEKATNSYSGPLPFIAIDAPDLPLESLSRLIGRFASLAEKLEVMTIFSLDSDVFQNLPLDAKKKFDLVMPLDPLESDEVAKLVESRVKSAGVDWKCSDDVSQSLLDQFNGNPGETIVQLRDYVDAIFFDLSGTSMATVYNNMKNQSSELDPLVEKFNDEIIDIVANDDEESVDEIVEQEKHRETEDDLKKVYSSPSTEFYSNDEHDLSNPEGNSSDSSSDDLIDDLIFPEFEEFNLDFDKLDEMKQSENVPSKPVKMPSGGLSGLRARMNSYDDKNQDSVDLKIADSDDSASIWVSQEAPLFGHEEKEMHVEEDEMELDLVEIDQEPNYFDSLAERSYSSDILDNNATNGEENNEKLVKMLQDILLGKNHNSVRENVTKVSKIVESLMSLNEPKENLEQERPLEISIFTNLNKKEAKVLAKGIDKEITPSDKEILEELDVKRPRLSQICNKLQKSGVFKSKKIGRSRYFSITSTAKAQMKAWGMLDQGGEY